MITNPSITYENASLALITWFRSIVPTLLPVLILSNLILLTDAWKLFIPFLHPILGRIFRISISGSCAILLGVLCGYPIGAKVVSDLYNKKELSKTEAKRLLTFVTFPSPMFLIGYVLEQTIKEETYFLPIIISIYGSAMIIGIIQSLFIHTYKNNTLTSTHTFTFSQFQQSFLSSAELILFVGFYMMFARILIGFIQLYFHTPFLSLFAGILEMTTGISLLSNSSFSLHTISTIAIFLCCFGGFSITMQTAIVLPKEKGWFSFYIIYKLIHSIVAVFLFQFF